MENKIIVLVEKRGWEPAGILPDPPSPPRGGEPKFCNKKGADKIPKKKTETLEILLTEERKKPGRK